MILCLIFKTHREVSILIYVWPYFTWARNSLYETDNVPLHCLLLVSYVCKESNTHADVVWLRDLSVGAKIKLIWIASLISVVWMLVWLDLTFHPP